jgi:hypothetical protein
MFPFWVDLSGGLWEQLVVTTIVCSACFVQWMTPRSAA